MAMTECCVGGAASLSLLNQARQAPIGRGPQGNGRNEASQALPFGKWATRHDPATPLAATLAFPLSPQGKSSPRRPLGLGAYIKLLCRAKERKVDKGAAQG